MSPVRESVPISSAVSRIESCNLSFNFSGYPMDCRGEEHSNFLSWHFHPLDSDLFSSQRLLDSRYSSRVGPL